MIYLDTSVVVAYYSPETFSRKAERIVRARTRPCISSLTEVEFFSALSRKVRRRELSPQDAVRISSQLLAHLGSNLYHLLALERVHYRIARDWLSQLSNNLRTLDALHLAVAASENLQLVTADESLARSAKALGIEVFLLPES